MDYLKAFLVGGLICALVQILMDKTKLMPGRIMVLLVCSGVALGFLGVYEPFIQWTGSGASVPLLLLAEFDAAGMEEALSLRRTDTLIKPFFVFLVHI